MNVSETLPQPAEPETDRPRLRSLDAWVMSSPTRAFRYVASQPVGHGIWLAARRPLFLAVVLGCVVSLLASGTLTARLVASASVYWACVPVIEVLALAAVIWRRRQRTSLPTAIDTFFAGHGPWTLCLIGIAATLASVPPLLGWKLLTTVCVGATALVIIWSACIDFCFFRQVFGASRGAAIRDAVVQRLITWTAVFAIFAVQAITPRSITQELAEALKEVLSR